MKKNSSAAMTAAALALVAAGAAHAADTPKLMPIEKACVDYQHAGQMMNGTSKRCFRNWGYEMVEIQTLTIGIAGFSQSQNQHVVTIGDQIYSINLDTNTGTVATNPLYQGVVDAVADADPAEFGQTMLAAMGYVPSGATKTIAGSQCTMYNSPQLGSVCAIPESAIVLEQSFMGNTQTATNVDTSTGGPDADYVRHQSAEIGAAPNLGDIMQMMQQGGQ